MWLVTYVSGEVWLWKKTSLSKQLRDQENWWNQENTRIVPALKYGVSSMVSVMSVS